MTENPETPDNDSFDSDILGGGELRALWDSQDASIAVADEATLLGALRETHRRENRLLRRLNIQEVLPAVVLAMIFTWIGLQTDTRAWGFFAAAALSFGVGVFMVTSTIQQRSAESVFASTMRGELQRSLTQANHRAWLYRNVAWWYLGPAALSVLVVRIALAGGRPDDAGSPVIGEVVFGSVFAAMLIGLWVINRRVGRTRYEPEVLRYREMLKELGD